MADVGILLRSPLALGCYRSHYTYNRALSARDHTRQCIRRVLPLRLNQRCKIRGVYAPGLLACGAVNSAEGRTDATYVSLPLYVCCLILVFVYLPTTGTNLVRLLISQVSGCRCRHESAWKAFCQGVVYFVAVLAAYVPALVRPVSSLITAALTHWAGPVRIEFER